MRRAPAPPRLHGAELVFAVRSRLIKGYPQTGGIPRFEQAKRDVNALLGEIELLTGRLAQVGPTP